MRARRGYTLIEALVACGVLGILVTVIFAVFQMGSGSFRTLVVRQGIQSEARRIATLMRHDMVTTSYRSCSTFDRTSPSAPGPLNERDILSFATLDDWADPANFGPTLKPNWNRYLVWYATTVDGEESPPYEKPELGQLVRKIVTPTSPAPPIEFAAPMSAPNPPSVTLLPSTGSSDFKILSRNLLHFSVTSDPADENMTVHLVLRQPGGQLATGVRKQVESFECFFDLRPENTFPSQ